MNYSKIYHKIIEKAKLENRIKLHFTHPDHIYYESHHILPESLGGSNKKENKVLLTGREHYICHKLLFLMYDDPDKKYRMACALRRFLHSKVNDQYYIKSRDYEKIRIEHAKAVSYFLKGKSHNHGDKVSTSLIKHFENNPGHFTGKTHSDETKKKMSKSQSKENNGFFGKHHDDETRQRISNTMKGHKKSPETVRKFRERKQSIETKEKIKEGLRLYHARRKQMASQMVTSS